MDESHTYQMIHYYPSSISFQFFFNFDGANHVKLCNFHFEESLHTSQIILVIFGLGSLENLPFNLDLSKITLHKFLRSL